jgi:hypothetical protein
MQCETEPVTNLVALDRKHSSIIQTVEIKLWSSVLAFTGLPSGEVNISKTPGKQTDNSIAMAMT